MAADLTLTGISKRFGANEVLNDLHLHIRSGEFVTLLGPSGCGKTTLLRMIAGLEAPNTGSLHIGGEDMKGLAPQNRPIAMVFQSYALFPHMNVKNNIIFGLKILKMPEHEIFEKLDWVMPLLGLVGLEKRLPKEISGGQRQRVALARALVVDPNILLLDEPLSNLDAALRESAMVELKRIHSKVGKTIIYVSHNQAEAMAMSERIAVMNNGRLEQFDEPRVLYDRPATLFTAQFIGSPSTNSFKGILRVSGKSVVVDLGFTTLKLSQEFTPTSIIDGEKVSICLRPQDIKTTIEDMTIENCFSLTVEIVETPGDRNLIVGVTDDEQSIRFFMSRQNTHIPGEHITLSITPDLIHVFDEQTGLRLPFVVGDGHE